MFTKPRISLNRDSLNRSLGVIFNQKILVRLRLQMQKNYYNNLKRKWINAKSYNLNEFVFYSFSIFSLAVQCDMSKDPKHKIEEK